MPYPTTAREVHVALEGTEGTEGTTYRHLHTMNQPAHTLQNGLVLVQENTGTRVQDTGQARGRRGSSIRIQSYVRMQEIGLWLSMMLSPAVTTGGPAPAHLIHTFKGGVAIPRSGSLRFYNGSYWRRMLGCHVNTMTITGSGNELAMVEVEVVGRASAKIAAPGAVTQETTYAPVDIPMQTVKFNGSINADVTRMGITFNNNLVKRPGMDGTTSVGRSRFGWFVVNFDGTVDYADYTGSLYEMFENNVMPASVTLVMVDDVSPISFTPTHDPSLTITIPDPVLVDTSEGDDAGELIQQVRGRGLYNSTDAASVVAVLTNDKPATYYQP